MIDIQIIKNYLLALQNQICDVFVAEDSRATFQETLWERPGGGGGITRAMENGKVFEKGGVNFSHVYGEQLPEVILNQHPQLHGYRYDAMGISIVMHPENPYAPTSHCNVRFFIATKESAEPKWWFGGGFDLTPYYGFDEDCVHWHNIAKRACDPFGEHLYPKFKQAADDYFYLKHRREPRGIGGLFFDYVNQPDFETCFAMMRSVGDHFLPAYQPIIARRKQMAYGKNERDFQCYRRGRYVEFNLIYDRGTWFGLQSDGRTESILMSLPPLVIWRYDWHPTPETPEAELYTKYLQPRDWIKF